MNKTVTEWAESMRAILPDLNSLPGADKKEVIMGTHPNVLIIAALKPEGLARKTMRDICNDMGVVFGEDSEIKIGDRNFSCIVMESDYYESMQISSDEGDLVFYDMVTYGYGECILWNDLQIIKEQLEEWASSMCLKYHCSLTIKISANYW